MWKAIPFRSADVERWRCTRTRYDAPFDRKRNLPNIRLIRLYDTDKYPTNWNLNLKWTDYVRIHLHILKMNEPVHHTSANVLVRVPVKIVAINDQNTKTKNNRIQFTHQRPKCVEKTARTWSQTISNFLSLHSRVMLPVNPIQQLRIAMATPLQFRFQFLSGWPLFGAEIPIHIRISVYFVICTISNEQKNSRPCARIDDKELNREWAGDASLSLPQKCQNAFQP